MRCLPTWTAVIAIGAMLLFARSASAAERDVESTTRGGIYPLTFEASMLSGPAGGEGRWGLVLERDPGRPAEGSKWSGFGLGLGLGLGGGFTVVGAAMDGPATTPSSTGGFIAPILRPGFFFAAQKELAVSGYLGVGFSPVVIVLRDGSARLALSAEPGFLISVQHFAFGLGMKIEDTVAAGGPLDARGFGVGAGFKLGGAI